MRKTGQCTSFTLLKGNSILAEKRKKDKKTFPGKVCILSGAIEKGETARDAAIREAHEELGITVKDIVYIGTIVDPKGECDYSIHYFVITKWTGKIHCYEAEKVFWISINDKKRLDLFVDRLTLDIIKIFKKIKRF